MKVIKQLIKILVSIIFIPISIPLMITGYLIGLVVIHTKTSLEVGYDFSKLSYENFINYVSGNERI